MRKKIIAGNWKMNKTLEEGKVLASEVVNMAKDEVDSSITLVLCPSYILLPTVNKLLEGSKVALGAQNCASKESGAYTGEVSAPMVASTGASYVILGHSERRAYFHETNVLLAEKVNLALKYKLSPIFCCGETLEQREQGVHLDFIKAQLSESLFHLSAADFANVVIAYEPIWAIGTGVTASSAQAQEMHAMIRNHIASKYRQEVADNTSILYGGSCKPDNAKELLACKDVDGGLIGGAALKSRDFIDIAKSF